MLAEYHQELLIAWEYFSHLAIVLVPLFLAGSFFVGLLQQYLPPERVERILRRYDGGSGNTVAAGIGAITPFCSASTVPVLAGLLGAGAPLGIAFSFLLASPLVNELAVLFLAGIFGARTTALYVVITLAAAIIGGHVIGKLGLEDHIKETELLTPNNPRTTTDGGRSSISCGATGTSQPDGENLTDVSCKASTAQSDGTCAASSAKSASHRMRVKRAAIGAKGFFLDLIPYLLLGMTLGAVIHAFVPTSFIHQLIGPENPFAVPIAAVAGAPIYVSMSAMLPIAQSFADQGIQIGTVLAFVVGSAGVSFPNLVLLNKLFDKNLLAIYASTVVATGIVIGVLFNAGLI
jgi:uncharacterized membrane protein YraQ (UPF0718 family)